MRKVPASVRIPLACALMSAIVAFGQTVAWAITACEQPNPVLKNCANPPPNAVPACNVLNNPGACNGSVVVQINQFPNGSVTAASGTTTQQVANCYRTQSCLWNAQTAQCMAGNWGPWVGANKTVVGANPCPTNEG